MHHFYPVFVEAECSRDAESIALCLWSGVPEDCGWLWPPPRRMSWEKGIYWDYITTINKIAVLDKYLELAGVDPEDVKGLKRCERWDGFCVDFPKRVSELGLDVARAILITALERNALLLYYLDEDGHGTVEDEADKVWKILKSRPDKIWVVWIDLHT